jgi:hypothetical protein
LERSIPGRLRAASPRRRRQTPEYESACWHYGVGCAELQTRFLGALFVIQQVMMPLKTETTVRKATAPDLEVGLICADRDGNRIRIDRVEHAGLGAVSYHFLNDELRVQEGVQERSLERFLAEGWYMAGPGRSL